MARLNARNRDARDAYNHAIKEVYRAAQFDSARMQGTSSGSRQVKVRELVEGVDFTVR